jgi:hypothetical protein
LGYDDHDAVVGLTPEQWHDRLEQAADDRAALEAALAELESEISREDSWLHMNPAPDSLLSGVLSFFSGDRDVDQLSKRIKSELHRELRLKTRFRGWNENESWRDRVFAYVKDFPGDMQPDTAGVQFPGWSKYQGQVWNRKPESYIFFINEKFPGRDPANFHVQFDPETGEVLIKRVYKMDLPRIEGISTAARAVLAEMISELIPDLSVVSNLVIDNAANIATRQALIRCKDVQGEPKYEEVEDACVEETPLGHMMRKLATELGLQPGTFTFRVLPYGLLRISIAVAMGEKR